MTLNYWYKECPFCRQGRLHLFEDITHNRLYLHCEECEWGWLNPHEASDPGRGFCTIDAEFESKAVNMDTIRFYGWEEYARHSYET